MAELATINSINQKYPTATSPFTKDQTYGDYIYASDLKQGSSNWMNGYSLSNASMYDDNQIVRLSDVKYGIKKSVSLKLRLAVLFALSYPSTATSWKVSAYHSPLINGPSITPSNWSVIGAYTVAHNDGPRLIYSNYLGSEFSMDTSNEIALTMECTRYNFDSPAECNDGGFILGLNKISGIVEEITTNASWEVISKNSITVSDFTFESNANIEGIINDKYKLNKAYLDIHNTGTSIHSKFVSTFNSKISISGYRLQTNGLPITTYNESNPSYISLPGVFAINSISGNGVSSLWYDSEFSGGGIKRAFIIGWIKYSTSPGFSNIKIPVYIVLG